MAPFTFFSIHWKLISLNLRISFFEVQVNEMWQKWLSNFTRALHTRVDEDDIEWRYIYMSKHHSFLHFPCHSCMVAPEYAIALWSKYNSNLATPGCEGEYLVTVGCVLIGFWAENQFVWWVVNFSWTTKKKKKKTNKLEKINSEIKNKREKTGRKKKKKSLLFFLYIV